MNSGYERPLFVSTKAYASGKLEPCAHGLAKLLAVLPGMLARKLRDLFLQGRLPIQHYSKGYGSASCHRHTDEKTSTVGCDLAANKTRW